MYIDVYGNVQGVCGSYTPPTREQWLAVHGSSIALEVSMALVVVTAVLMFVIWFWLKKRKQTKKKK